MDFKARLQSLLEEAIALDRAAKGTLQAFDQSAGVLRIVCHVGFDDAFLRHFEEVRAFDSSVCGRAFGSGGVVLVPDVQADSAFIPHLEVARANGVRSVKSMPLTTADGLVVGVLSTHSPSVRWDWERENTRHLGLETAGLLEAIRSSLASA